MNKNDDLIILSVGQAISMLAYCEDNKDRLKIVAQVTGQERVRGSADDYHNLSVQYTINWDDYVSGFNIVERGLQYYPRNVDLLADAIYYGSCAGEYEKCEQYEIKLNEIPVGLWNWRAFTFLIDYYLQKSDRLAEVNDNIILGLTERALTYAQLEQIALTGDGNVERGFLAEHKIRVIRERCFRVASKGAKLRSDEDKAEEWEKDAEDEKKKAEAVLQRAISDGSFAATACCLKLADIFFERQDFVETIRVSKTALSMPQSQPSANTGYFMYLIAMSEDAMIHQENLFEDKTRIESVYRTYLGAYRCNGDRDVYRDNIRKRIAVLEARSGISAVAFHQVEEEKYRNLIE